MTSNYFSLSGGIAIGENEDLDDSKFWTIGNYYCSYDLAVVTLKNCPVKNAFTMKVFLGQGTSYPTQVIRDYYYGKIYYRINNGAITEWIRLAEQEEIPFQNYIETNVIPSEISTVYQYSNPAITGKPCVIVMFPNTVGTAVVCAGSPTYINMRTKADNQYWGGEVAVDYDSAAGAVSFSVLWKGESQTLNNFGLKGIRY